MRVSCAYCRLDWSGRDELFANDVELPPDSTLDDAAVGQRASHRSLWFDTKCFQHRSQDPHVINHVAVPNFRDTIRLRTPDSLVRRVYPSRVGIARRWD